jgi:AraC-like DNA-binding protein
MYAISHKNQSLSEIAFDLGFYDQAHFTRTFKRFAGMTPKEYQNSHKGVIPEFVMIE